MAGVGAYSFPDLSTFSEHPQYTQDDMSILSQQQYQEASSIYQDPSLINLPQSNLVPLEHVVDSTEDTSYHQSSVSFEEGSSAAAEEDKRRRNTAASARFRVKKRQREQALERSAKEMNDKVTELQEKVLRLETENKWFKNLVMEKNEHKGDDSESLEDHSQDTSDSKSSEQRKKDVETEE
jgi:hypothetical protein